MNYLNVKLDSMLIFNRSRALNRVNDERRVLEVRPPIEVPSKPSLGIRQLLTLTGYSSELK